MSPASREDGGGGGGDNDVGYAHVGCTVTPEFRFQSFELGDRETLLAKFGEKAAARNAIIELTCPPPLPLESSSNEGGAAEGGNLAMLQWLKNEGCPWDNRTCAYAAKNGHMDVLKWARGENCPWDEVTCAWPLEVATWKR